VGREVKEEEEEEEEGMCEMRGFVVRVLRGKCVCCERVSVVVIEM
jgi:hypothetical protein